MTAARAAKAVVIGAPVAARTTVTARFTRRTGVFEFFAGFLVHDTHRQANLAPRVDLEDLDLDFLTFGQDVKVKLLEVDQRGKVRLSMRVVDQETGAELEDTRPAREPREGGDRPRGDRGPRRDGGGDRGPRRERSEGPEDQGHVPDFLKD